MSQLRCERSRNLFKNHTVKGRAETHSLVPKPSSLTLLAASSWELLLWKRPETFLIVIGLLIGKQQFRLKPLEREWGEVFSVTFAETFHPQSTGNEFQNKTQQLVSRQPHALSLLTGRVAMVSKTQEHWLCHSADIDKSTSTAMCLTHLALHTTVETPAFVSLARTFPRTPDSRQTACLISPPGWLVGISSLMKPLIFSLKLVSPALFLSQERTPDSFHSFGKNP